MKLTSLIISGFWGAPETIKQSFNNRYRTWTGKYALFRQHNFEKSFSKMKYLPFREPQDMGIKD